MKAPKSENIKWHNGEVTRADRCNRLGQKGATLWFTGLSGSGKSTAAVAVERALHGMGKLSYRLDGDNVRHGINNNLGFSHEDRTENIRRIGEISKLYCDTGIIALSSFISPYREDRDQVRKLHEDGGYNFIEIFVDSTLEEAEKRDPKGLYKKARAGEIKNFTGIDAPYEEPLNPEIHLHTNQITVEEEVEIILDYLQEQRYLILYR